MAWETLAAELAQARGRGMPVTPPSMRGDFDLEDGYAVGRLLAEHRVAAGHRTAGVKIGLTNPAAWPRLGIDHPVWAPVYEDTVVGDEHYPIGGLTSPRLEVEVVVKLAAAVPVGATIEELSSAVEWAALGFEIVDCHYPDWKLTPADLVADHGLHVGLVIGPPRVASAAELQDLVVTLSKDGAQVAQGRGSDVLGGPLSSLAALSRAPYARALHTGEIVSTGALTGGAHPVTAGETWVAETSLFPPLEVAFR
jgi:2-oxo-3-hexenedioate decarboxylase